MEARMYLYIMDKLWDTADVKQRQSVQIVRP